MRNTGCSFERIMMDLRLKPSSLLYCFIIALFVVLPSVVHAGWTIQGVDTPRSWKSDSMSDRALAIDKTTGYPHIAYGGDHLYHAYYNGVQWVYETVDPSPAVGNRASIAVDSNGKIHISYIDSLNGNLKYATNVLNGVWASITVDTDSGKWSTSSIAVDGNNKVHISYYNDSNDNLKYATNAGGSWEITTVDNTSDFNFCLSIAVDNNGKVHISYYDSAYQVLKYATNAAGSWAAITVDSAGNVGFYNSITVDSSNNVHISYFDWTNYDLKYATNSSGSWVSTTVDSSGDVGYYTSIAVDSSNHSHISYYDSANHYLKYATDATGSWEITTVDSEGWLGANSSIALDLNNKVHISFAMSLIYDLKYATNTSGSWVIETVDDSSSIVGESSIAIDSSNKLHISYYDAMEGDLKYATNISGSWEATIVDSEGWVGACSSIALDSNNKVHISYYDLINQNLKYATNATGTWTTITVDAYSWDTNGVTSIAIDSNNKVHISYYDSTNFDLGYATNVSGSWAIYWPDTGGDVGKYNSIAIDSSNKVHISYYDRTNYDLKYITNATGSWIATTLDSAGDVGHDVSIAVDSGNKIHVSYYDWTNYDLKYITNATGSWVATTLDSAGDVGEDTSIAVDGSSKIHISYYDESNDDLKYATNASGSWLSSTIDSVAWVGKYSSIAVDSNNKVHISYYDESNGDLKYATNAPIDITPPVGTITINNNAVYANNATVTLTLTCGDLQGSCSLMQFSNDGISWSTPPEAYPQPDPATKEWNVNDPACGGSSSDGLKYVYARFRDDSGNWTASYSDAITLDSTNPTGTITINSGADSTNTTAVSLSLTCSDDGGSGCYQMRFSNDNSTWSNPESVVSGKSWNLSSGDDLKTVYVKYFDVAGNEFVETDTITLDTTPPNAPSVSGMTPTNNKRPVWTWTHDAVGGSGNYQYKLDSGSWTGTTSISFSPASDLSDGDHTLYVQERDDLNNWSSSGSLLITIDATPPNAPTVSGTTPTNNKRPVWTWTHDAVGGSGNYQYKLDGSSWTGTTSTSYSPASDLSDGDHTLYVQERDALNNWSSSGSFLIMIDATPPNAPTVSGTTPTNNKRPTWTWTHDAVGGSGNYQYKLDSGSWTGTTSTSYSPTSDLNEGDHTLYVQERDDLNNWSSSGSFAITIDVTPPNDPAVTGNTPTSDSTPTWSWSSNGGGCGDSGGIPTFRYKLDNADLSIGATTTTSFSYTQGSSLPDGPHTLYVQERDEVGNWSGSGGFQIEIDTTPPNPPSVTGTTPTNNQTPTWSWTSNGGGYGPGQGVFRYKLDDSNLTSGATETVSLSYTPGSALTDGTHTLYVQERDALGNWSASGSFAITIDATPPNAPSVTGTTPTNDQTPTWSWTSGGGGGTGNYRYKLDDNYLDTGAIYTSSLSYTPGSNITDGSHMLYVQERDPLGNWSASGSFAITIDATPPDAPSVTGSTPTSDSTPTWSWSSNGGGGYGIFRYKLDDNDLDTGATFTTSLSYTPGSLPDGPHILFVQERDDVGNWSASGSFVITIDTTPPNSPAVGGITPTNDQTPTWFWSSKGGGGIGTFRYKLDDSNLTYGATETTSLSYTPVSALTDGTHTLYVQERDALGNWSASEIYAITIDATPPNAPSVTGTTPTNDQTPVWSWSSNGGGGNGTFRYKLDDSNLTAGATETTATGFTPSSDLSEGSHILYVQERDAVGNWSASGSFSIAIDITLPDSPIVTGTTPTNSVRPTWNWSSTIGNTNFRYKLDDSNLTTGATETTATSFTPGSDLPEGSHTLYVQEKDPAGNWSDSDSHTILIDITAPSGGITINSGAAGTNDPNVALDLTCDDGAGSGCSEMRFSDNGGTSWTTPEAFAATKPWVLSGDGDKTIYVKFKDGAANWSGDTAISDVIKLDTAAPVTTPSAGTGTYATTQTVTLTCDDGTGSGCAETYYCLGVACTPSTLYTTPFTFNEETTLRYYSKDALGNTEAVQEDVYTFVQTATDLSIELSAPRILSGGTVDVVGQLLRIPEDGESRNGLTIRFEITGPSPVPPATQTVTYDTSGLYSHTISGFIAEGIYNIKAVFDGHELLLNSESNEMSVYVGPSAGYAIIVEGKIPSGAGLDSHNKTTNRIYTKLKARGFDDSDIYYFNYDTGQDGVDETPTKAAVQAAIEYWAKFKMNEIAAPLYIIMTNHGNSTDGIYLNSESITPGDLNAWLNTLEAGLNTEALQKKRVVIAGACYSGAFIPAVSKSGRVVISSAAGDEVSHKGPYEYDAGQEVRSGEYFMEELFTYLERGYSIRDAFINATEKTEIFTRRDSVTGEAAPYYDEAVQHPLLDDDGDGYGSNVLSGTGDGSEVDEMYLGVGNYYVPNKASNPAEVTGVTETVYLGSGSDLANTSYTMWTEVNDDAKVDGGRIWFEVRSPSKTLTAGSGSDQAVADYVHNFLTKTGPLHWEKEYGNCTDPCNKFDEYGRYEIFYFVRDAETQQVSPMKRSFVYKDSPANLNYPGAFNLTSPADDSEQMKSVILDWEESVDPDGDEVTYTVMISEDSTFTTVDYIMTDIKNTWVLVGENGELSDLATYYWKVVAVDPYGKHTESNQVWSFHPNSCNDPANCNGTELPGIITGYIYVSGSNPKVPVAGASIATSDSRSATSGSNGFYSISNHNPGTWNISVTHDPEHEPANGTVSVTSLKVTAKDLYMAPSCTPATEVCDGQDNDCDGLIDDNDPDLTGQGTWHPDSDGDGYGSTSVSISACIQAAGNVPDNTDCDDSDEYIYPDGPEVRIYGAPDNYYWINDAVYDLQRAYSDAIDNDIIQIKAATYTDSLSIDENKTVVIEGGYTGANNCGFTGMTGKTTVNGNVTISDGKVKILIGTLEVQ